ncbi:MAG: RecQ family ATP-dependent DNA helicase [Flavobacteriales bacterium]|nr:RecQ family ATP-dependent DNA helicase [Flavobacteriales bacterium]
MQALDILKKYWGYNTFRLKQEEVINSVLKSKDTLALLPTAGGKSICFQVPALMKDGICLVISPLISLMEDQIKYLKSKGIKSVSISSSMSNKDIQTALTNCLYGGIKFLYLSPEKLRDQLIKEKINQMNLNLIAVDEAHCISDWGHNFRPSYRLISEIRDTKENIPILALTATANKLVVDDIQNNLNFKEKNIIKSTFLRKNLSYVAVDCSSKKNTLLALLNKFKSSVIIYVNSRKESNEIALFLKNNNISSTSYHAGIEFKKRIRIQEEWSNNLTRVIVATNAFGLGINKEDIRLIIHMQIPMNMEFYYQEAGRAGRDGKTAYSFILYDRLDFKKNINNLNIWYPSIDSIKNIYQKICDYFQIAIHELPDEDFQFNISNFCNRYNLDIKQTFIIINFLEKEELIKLYDSKNIKSKIKIIISNSELYKFQIANSYYDNFIKIILRNYSNIFNNFVNIEEKKIEKQLNIKTQSVRDILLKLEQNRVIKYKQNEVGMQLRFLQNRKDSEKLNISKEKILNEKKLAKEKLDIIIKYINNKNKCRSENILKYFNEEIHERCNICDNCIAEKKKNLKDLK